MKFLYILIGMLILLPSVSAIDVWNLHLTFVDEDDNTIKLQPVITVNGVSSPVSSSGVVDFNVVENPRADVIATLFDYQDKNFVFGYDNNINQTIGLLKSSRGESIEMIWKTPNGETILTDSNISVFVDDYNRLVGRTLTDSSGISNFFMLPYDQNYMFQIETTSGDYNTGKRIVGISIPRDEDTNAQIFPYTLKMGGIGAQNIFNTSTDSAINVFPFTRDFYIANVDRNSEYYPRSNYFRINRIDQNFDKSFLDNFTDVNGSSVNSGKWIVDNNESTGSIQIENNYAKINTIGSGSGTPITYMKNRENISVPVGGSVSLSFNSPLIGENSGGNGTLLAVLADSSITNPNLFAGVRIGGFLRNDNNTVTVLFGSSNSSFVNESENLDFSIFALRTSATTWDVNFFINDTNLVESQTVSVPVSDVRFYAGSFVSLSSGDTNSYIDTVKINGITGDLLINPYLAKKTQANQVTVKIQKIFEATQDIPGIRVVSSIFIEGAGIQVIESVVTDSQGQGVMSFLTDGSEYTLQLFDSSNNLIRTQLIQIAPSQTELSISIEPDILFPPPIKKLLSVLFTPSGGTITGLDVNILARITYDINSSITDINLIIQQNDLNLSDLNANHFIGTSPFDVNMSINVGSLDTTQLFSFIVHIQTSDGNSSFYIAQFNLPRTVNGQDVLNDIIRGKVKTDFGCEADDWLNICPPTFFISMLFSAFFSAALLGALRVANPNLAIFIFMIILGLFTYFYWVPAIFYSGLLVFGALTSMALVRVNL